MSSRSRSSNPTNYQLTGVLNTACLTYRLNRVDWTFTAYGSGLAFWHQKAANIIHWQLPRSVPIFLNLQYVRNKQNAFTIFYPTITKEEITTVNHPLPLPNDFVVPCPISPPSHPQVKALQCPLSLPGYLPCHDVFWPRKKQPTISISSHHQQPS
jgi:hypothetical protein